MSEASYKTKGITPQRARSRVYEAEAVALQSLRLIAAPNPEDDLSDEELAEICRDPSTSTDLIKHLIECIKAI